MQNRDDKFDPNFEFTWMNIEENNCSLALFRTPCSNYVKV